MLVSAVNPLQRLTTAPLRALIPIRSLLSKPFSAASSGWPPTSFTTRTRARNPDGSKVGGHQASSASVVSILTALYFEFLRAGDRVSIKPHASPVFHALQYLMGNLDRQYLTTLRHCRACRPIPAGHRIRIGRFLHGFRWPGCGGSGVRGTHRPLSTVAFQQPG